LKLLVWVKIGYVKSSQNGEILPNQVTLIEAEAANKLFLVAFENKIWHTVDS
jgi:hypothetical protein